jgi:hypothetical protein
MGQIEDLVECWIESNKLPFGYEGVESIAKKLQSYIDVCDILPIEDKIKALSFLYDKCDYILNSIASAMNYQLEYEPTDDEIWNFIEQERENTDIKSEDLSYWKYFISEDNIEDIVSFDKSTLYEHVIDPMRELYREKNKEASEWCDKIEDIQTNIYIKISKEKEKQAFLKEFFKSKGEVVKTSFDEYITPICPNKEILKIKLKQILYGEKGRNVALSLIALDNLKYINLEKIAVKKIFGILQSEFGVIGSRTALDTALNKIKDNKNDSKNIIAINKDIEILRQ